MGLSRHLRDDGDRVDGVPAAERGGGAAGRVLGGAGALPLLGRGGRGHARIVGGRGALLLVRARRGAPADPPLRALLLRAREEVAAGRALDQSLLDGGDLLRTAAPG